MTGKFCQKHAFLCRRIAAAHNENFFSGEKLPVAGCAVRNTPPFVFFLPFKADRSGVSSGCQQNTKAAKIALACMHSFYIPGKIKACSLCQHKFCTEVFCLLLYGIGQGFATGFGNAGIVYYLVSNGDLPAELFLFQHQHPVFCPGKVQCGGQPRRAAADDHYIVEVFHYN